MIAIEATTKQSSHARLSHQSQWTIGPTKNKECAGVWRIEALNETETRFGEKYVLYVLNIRINRILSLSLAYVSVTRQYLCVCVYVYSFSSLSCGVLGEASVSLAVGLPFVSTSDKIYR